MCAMNNVTTPQRVSIIGHVSTVDPVPYIVWNCLLGFKAMV